MMKKKPFLLLSNDDGFAAKGIQELIKVLRPMADLLVVAPSGPRSGASGSITSEYPLRCKKIESAPGFSLYSCTGTLFRYNGSCNRRMSEKNTFSRFFSL